MTAPNIAHNEVWLRIGIVAMLVSVSLVVATLAVGFTYSLQKAILFPVPYLFFMFLFVRGAYRSRLKIGHIIVVAIIVRLVALWGLHLLYTHYNGVPFALGTIGDDSWYHTQAIVLLESGFDPNLDLGRSLAATGYMWWNAILYWVFVPSTVVAKFANLLMGVGTVYIIYHISRDIFSERVARTAAALTASFPLLVYYNSMQFKDTVITFLLVVFILFAIKGRWPLLLRAAGMMIPVTLMATFRPSTSVFLLFILPIWLVLQSGWTSKGNNSKLILRGVALLIIFIVVSVPIIQFTTAESVEKALKIGVTEQIINKRFQKTAFSRSEIGAVMKNNLYLVIPVAALISPVLPPPMLLPQKSSSGGIAPTTVIAPAVIIWMIIAPLSYHGIFLMLKYYRRDAFLIYSVFGATAAGLALQFLILTDRHKMQLLPIAMIAVALSLEYLPNSKVFKPLLPVFVILMLIGTLVYNLLRTLYGSI